MNAPNDLPLSALKKAHAMTATVVYAHNPFDPADREIRRIHRRRRIDKLAPNTTLPFIATLNGVPILRANKGWHKSLKDGDVLIFVIRQQGGGGGSNPLKVVLMIGLTLAAPGIGNALATSMGIEGGIFALGNAFTVGDILGSVVGFVGKMAINAMMPDGGGSSHQQVSGRNIAAGSPTYSLTAQGNSARLLEPIPVQYGRHICYPDFAADPYTEYAGNEQYLYQLFVIGQGEYSIESIRIEDSLITNFPEVTTEIVAPHSQVTLMPTNVVTAPEVNGQELTGAYVGGFAASAPGTLANYIGFDAVCPRGLFYANDSGGLNAKSVTFRFEARLIDNTGTPLGGWVTLGTEVISGATATAIRRSYRYSVSQGRYECRALRLDVKDTSSRSGHDVMWGQLRAYLPGAQDYGGVTLLAVRMRATNSLSSAASRRVNVIATRKLPIWNGTTWSAPTATRNPAWAMSDVLRATYGAKQADKRIDLAALLTLSATYATRGDNFDGRFDQHTVVFDALTAIGEVCRTKPYQHGGVWHFWRDQPQTLPVAMFNMRNIVRGSVKMQYLTPDEDTADAMDIEFFDEATWSWQVVRAKLPGSYAEKVAKRRMFGIANRQQAWREGMYKCAANRYRRSMGSNSTEMEGFIPTYGDLLAVQHDRPRWGQAGEVVAYDAGSKTVTTSEPLDFSAGGNHYMRFRNRNGSGTDYYLVTAGVDAWHGVLDVALSFTPYTGLDEERTLYSFGPSDKVDRLCLTRAVRPRSLEKVELAWVLEDPAVHTADTGTAPPASTYWNLPARITSPAASGLNVALGGNATTPLLLVDWLPAAGAEYYDVDYSYDSGLTWTRAGEPSVSNIAIPARRGSVTVRVRGVALAAGPWASWTGDPFMAAPPDVAQFLVSVQPDGTRQFDAAMPGALPPDMAGYIIRYRLGTGWTWNDLYPMHAGVITQTPFESNQLAAGSYTFGIKAVDDSGHESANANFIVADLADPRLAGVVFATRAELYGWPGTRTSCYIEPEINALSAADSTTWADLTTWDAWTSWNMSPAGSMTYEHTVIDLGAPVPITPLVSAIADGPQTIEVATSNDGSTWSSWAALVFVTARYFKVRVTVTGAWPMLYSLDIKLSGNSISEEVNDVATGSLTGSYRIGTGDIRIPVVKTYALITQVQVTLQNVGAGWSVELIDKNTSVGPRIKIYNASNALADCTIDVAIKGA